MTFTDDDLKRLKKWIQTDIPENRCKEIEALLARLEAAEVCAEKPCPDCGFRGPKKFIECAEHKAWRKSCGKAGE